MRGTSPPWLLFSQLLASAIVACAPAALLPAQPEPARSAAPATPPAAPPPVISAPVEAPAPPAPPPQPQLEVRVVMETPYKMDERVDPPTEAEFLAELRERRIWNSGGMGELVGEQRPVIATISTAGAVLRPKLVDSELDDGAEEGAQVAKCFVDKLRALKMPRAAQSSRAVFAIRVGPGDEPVPPPDDLLVPGDGTLAVEDMRAGVEPALPAFEQCYRDAFDYAPALWGRLEIRFHLTDRGKLDEAFESVETMFPDPRVRQCVLGEARKLKFKKPKDGDLRFFVAIRFSNSRSVIPTAQPVQ
jgi:hypothetical protein